MHVVIVGGGSVGMLMAARLQHGGIKAHLLTRSREQSICIREKQLTLEQLDNKIIQVPVAATVSSDEWPIADVYLLAVKQTELKQLLPSLRKLHSDVRIIAMQNGMGHKEALETAIKPDQLFFGVNTEGSRRLSHTQVKHTGKGMIRIGPWDKRETADPVIKRFVSLAGECGIPMQYVEETCSLLWRKLLANALINPLTSLFEIANGELLPSPHIMSIMRGIFEEAVRVAQENGQKITEDDWQDILAICRSTSQNYSSMLQDLLNGKPTEIDSINGYIVDKARELNITAPMNETLYRAVLLKSSLRRSKGETFDANFD